ncbi:hypothetical protein L226DRAFT_612052 [Lentinus tigrinus ALCF2SS1-7]|uniref:Uncharacterized protein n=1 Tax=Lentinus tigrinus ALCF2SS1-6 TaxID=1328759 RepID=A0A5C2SGJ3_9APHY|nr:hypothetical protein L227DRAFT_611030 [Lentinus tigrinus ALCF2SS1-6]RPD75729.1 hypothetical protein L226DRAFT_612052 [Lentinus tigrinus ALCF2SS1-7]
MPGKSLTVKDAFGPKKPTTKAGTTVRLPFAPQTKTQAKAASQSSAATPTTSQSGSLLPIGKDAEPVAPSLLLPRPPSLYNPAAPKKA